MNFKSVFMNYCNVVMVTPTHSLVVKQLKCPKLTIIVVYLEKFANKWNQIQASNVLSLLNELIWFY